MTLVIREVKNSKDVKVSTVPEKIKREEFERGLEEQGFTFTTNSKKHKCYSLSFCDALFIICTDTHWEARLFCKEPTYSLGKREYKGVVNGLKLLRSVS